MIYKPSEDSFLLAGCVRQYRGKSALEIGVGSGIILEALDNRFDSVAGTDIDIEALRFCKRTNALLICCDAATAFSTKVLFDMIVSNPPYLPDDEGMLDATVHGGPAGIETTVRFIKSSLPLLSPGGKILVIVSSLEDSSALYAALAGEKLNSRVIKETKLFYETLSVIELSR